MSLTTGVVLERHYDELIRRVGDAPGENGAQEVAAHAFVHERPASFAALEHHPERLAYRQVLAAHSRLHM